jgi:hypothetical protein
MSFTGLPAELRITIYREILEAARLGLFHNLRNSNLRDYQGLILTNHQLHAEFISGADKTLHTKIKGHWPSSISMYIAPPSHLSQCAKPCISIPQSSILPRTTQTMRNLSVLLKFLYHNVAEFMLSIDSETRSSPWFDDEQYGMHMLEDYPTYRADKPVMYQTFDLGTVDAHVRRPTDQSIRITKLDKLNIAFAALYRVALSGRFVIGQLSSVSRYVA